MPNPDSTLQTYQTDPSAGVEMDFSYTYRTYQVSNIVIQDPNKEGILRYFENINYNSINKTTQEETSQPSSTPSSTMPGGQSSGTY